MPISSTATRQRASSRRRSKAAGASTSWSTTPASSAATTRSTFTEAGLGRGAERQPEDRRSSSPRRPRSHGRRRPRRQDHQHRLDALVPGRHPHCVLHGEQERPGRPHAPARQRVGGTRASTSTPSPRATSRPTTPPRYAATSIATATSSVASRPGAGASRRTSAARRYSSPSAASDYVHGTIIPVDGGWLAR